MKSYSLLFTCEQKLFHNSKRAIRTLPLCDRTVDAREQVQSDGSFWKQQTYPPRPTKIFSEKNNIPDVIARIPPTKKDTNIYLLFPDKCVVVVQLLKA